MGLTGTSCIYKIGQEISDVIVTFSGLIPEYGEKSKIQIRLCHLHASNLSEASHLPLEEVQSPNLLTLCSSCSSPQLWLLLFPSFHPLLKPQWTFSPITVLSVFSALAHTMASVWNVLPPGDTGLILWTLWDTGQKFSPETPGWTKKLREVVLFYALVSHASLCDGTAWICPGKCWSLTRVILEAFPFCTLRA